MQDEKDEGLVEVQNPDTKAWYQARLASVNKDKFVISYEDPRFGKEYQEVSCTRVRSRPRIGDKSRIEYTIDEMIEVFTRNQKWEAEGWWTATIKNKKGNFFYVAYENTDKYDEIVEKNRLRPINTRETLKASDYIQSPISIRKELYSWASNIEESEKSLSDIRVKSNCLVITFDKNRKNIIIVGKSENVETAKLLLDIVLSHQIEVLHHNLDLKGEDRSKQDQIIDFIDVEEQVLNLLGGITAEYFEQIKEKNNVFLEKQPSRAEGRVRISITASSRDTLEAAKKQLMLSSIVLLLLPEQAGYLKSKLAELQEKSKIVCTIDHSLTEDATTGPPKITAIGTEESLKNFKLSVEMLLNIMQKANEEKQKQEVAKPEEYHKESGYKKFQPHRGRPVGQSIVYRKKA